MPQHHMIRAGIVTMFAVVILSVLLYLWLHQPPADLGQLPTL